MFWHLLFSVFMMKCSVFCGLLLLMQMCVSVSCQVRQVNHTSYWPSTYSVPFSFIQVRMCMYTSVYMCNYKNRNWGYLSSEKGCSLLSLQSNVPIRVWGFWPFMIVHVQISVGTGMYARQWRSWRVEYVYIILYNCILKLCGVYTVCSGTCTCWAVCGILLCV